MIVAIALVMGVLCGFSIALGIVLLFVPESRKL